MNKRNLNTTTLLKSQQLRELATMLNSGIPVSLALEKLNVIQQPACHIAIQQLGKGLSLAGVLQYLKLIDHSQKIYLTASERAGCLDKALLQLASDFEEKDRLCRELNRKIYVAYFLLLVGWSVSLINAISANSNLVMVIIVSSFVALAIIGVMKFVKRIALKGSWQWLEFAWRFNVKNTKSYEWVFISNWYSLLTMQVSAGVDLASAIAQMKYLIKAKPYNRSVSMAFNDLRNGLSISEALSRNGLLPCDDFQTVLLTGEATGGLSEVVDHQIEMAKQQVELLHRSLSLWVPKILYFVCGSGALVLVF